MKNNNLTISWAAQIIAAIILGQTLFFKFTGAEESVALFTKLGAEPFGRYIAGTMELIAVILLLSSRTAWIGALLGIGVMSGAIISHLTIIGIESNGDGGLLFGLAIVTLICCSTVAYLRKSDILIKFHLFL
jgi:uncharacterized membrane protein YphA (DoxX/SURF4 family)